MSRWLPPLALAMGLAGCAHLPVESDGLSFAERRARLERIDAWQMRGRLAIDTGERAFQARFQWRQNNDRLLLTVRGLLGAGSFQIDGSAETLTLRTRGEVLVLDDPEAELSDLFGWWLPVTSLDHWLMGLPDESFAAETRTDRSGTLTSLAQRLWELDYTEYQVSEGLLLPRRLKLSHGPLRLDLRVDAWSPVVEDSLN